MPNSSTPHRRERQRYVPTAIALNLLAFSGPAKAASVGIFAFCSEDPRKVAETQAIVDYRLLGFEKGRYDEIPTYAAASAYSYTPAEWQRVLYNRQRTAIGTPEQLKDKL